MTVNSSVSSARIQGDGVSTVFTVPFYFLDDSHLDVSLVDTTTDTLTELVLGTDYSVQGAGDQEGGSVTMLTGAPPATKQMLILRNVPIDQQVDYTPNDKFPAEVTEQALDKLTMIAQQLAGEVTSSIHFPLSEYGTSGELPIAALRAGYLLAFDSVGNISLVPLPASVGAGDLKNESWTDGVDYTAGTSNSVQLSRTYGTKANLGTVVMGGIAQDPASYALSGTTLTFDAVIPVGISRIWCVGGTTLSLNQPATGSVGPAQLADAYGTTAQRPTPIKIGQHYFDTTVGYDVVSTSVSPATWKNAAGGAADNATFKLNDIAVAGAAAFSLSPTGPTPALSDSSNKFATTAFFKSLQTFPNIVAYGGVADGVTDNSAAFAAALAASPAGRKGVFFPPGRFAFTNNINYTFPNNTASITIAGAGADITEIVCNLSGFPGIAVTYLGPLNSAHVRDLTLTSPYAGGGNSGIYLNQSATTIANPATSALSDITNVTIRGSDGYELTNYFSEGVLVQCVSNINFTNVVFVGSSAVSGQGVQLGATATALGVVYNFVGCSFIGNGNGIYYGQYIQGVTVTACNFACVNGILAPSGGLAGLDQLYVAGSQFNCIGAGILLQSPMNAIMIVGNFFLVTPNGSGITIQNVAQFTIYGNTFNPSVGSITNATGIVIGAYTAWGGVITGNQFAALTLAINLQSTSKFVNVQSNSYSGNTTNILNSGTSNTIGGGSQ